LERTPRITFTAGLRVSELVHEFALSYAATFESQPDRVLYCEHGNEFDPANAINDYDTRSTRRSGRTSSPT
jgi:hypothetical protein